MHDDGSIPLRVGEGAAFDFQRGRNDLALFAALGAALAEIQSFEFGLATQLGLLTRLDPAEFWSRTLGRLIRELQQQLPDHALADRLELVRRKRNHVVHSVLRSYGWPLMSDSKYIRAVKEIEDIRSLIEGVGVEVARYLSDRSLLKLLLISIDRETGNVNREV